MAETYKNKPRKNPNTKSGRYYSLSDLAFGDETTFDEAIEDAVAGNKVQVGVVRSLDSKTPDAIAKEIENILNQGAATFTAARKAKKTVAAKAKAKKTVAAKAKAKKTVAAKAKAKKR